MKKYVAASIFFIGTFLLIGLISKYSPFLQILELKGYDFMMATLRGPLVAPEDIVIIAIDETSLAEFETLGLQYPWPRSVHGELVQSLNAAGVRAIVFDVVFAGESDVVEDEYLAEAISESEAPVILAATRSTVDDPRIGILTQHLLPEDEFLAAGAQPAYVLMYPDQDEGLRKAPLSIDERPSLSVQCYSHVAGPLDLSEVPIADFEEEDPEILVNFVGGTRSIYTVSYYQALDPATYLPAGALRDKIALVGRSMAVEDLSGQDAFPVPFALNGLMPGVEVHANVLNTLLRRNFITAASPLSTWITLIVLALLVSAMVLGFESFLLKIFLSFALMIGYEVTAALLFIYQNHWIYTAQPFVIMLTIFGLNTLYQYWLTEQERAHIRRALKGYVSRQVMNEVLKNPAGLERRGIQVQATVLFSDIAEFSKISEKVTPKELFALLNDYFTRIGDVIMKHDGMINKYMGDAVMAIWNAPMAADNHAALACQTALEMKRVVDDMHPLKMRVGINTGQMMVGNLGHAERMEYTVIGDAVNLAFRLEGANKLFGTSVMISETTEELVRGRFLLRLIDRIRVSGKEQPVRVYEVMAGISEPVPEQVHAMVQSFEKIQEAYEGRDWDTAFKLAKEHLARFGSDRVARVYLERCLRFQETPPPADWDGVYALESK